MRQLAYSIVAAALAAVALMVPRAAFADPGCRGSVMGCGVTVVETASDFSGAIVVPGSDEANAIVGRGHGCDGCAWTLVLNCDRNTTEDPAYTNCNAARCPDGNWFRLFLQRPGDAGPAYVDTICLSPTRAIVTPADLAVDAQRYLTSVRPPPPAIRVQPDGRAVTGLATFFVAEGERQDATTLDVTTPAGPATLRLEIGATTYAWQFGDGATCETTEPGGPYDGTTGERCDDRVAHVYTTANVRGVRLGTTWTGTYTFDVGYGAVGPLPIPGTGVTAPEATANVTVREARAVLVGR